MKQLNFIPQSRYNSRKEHGGSLLLGRRRKQRPLSVKTPLHLVLKSDFATSSRSLLRHRPLIESIIKNAQRRFHIRVYEMAIVSNHIHLLIKGKHRRDIQNFFRVVAGHIAQEILRQFPILESERHKKHWGGAPSRQRQTEAPHATRDKENKFWQTRLYSRVVSWGREFFNVKKYVVRNTLEALGFITYKSRSKKRKSLYIIGNSS